MDILDAICALPKIELHVHVLGSIRPETLLSIIENDGISSPYSNVADIRKRFEYTDFLSFLQTYMEIIGYILDEGHFERLTYELLENCSKSSIKYVEISFSPRDHMSNHLEFAKMVDAIKRGIRKAKREFGIDADIRVDIVRNSTFEEASEILDLIEEHPDNIISIDIGGNEKEYPPRLFTEIFKRGRENGLHCVAHAGEAVGPQSIWEAISFLNVERIGHGVTAREDPKLIEYLKENQIAIEMCPVSNLRTGAVGSIREHPIREFFDKGLLVTVNSDDPSLFHTDMNNEFLQLHKNLDFSLENLFQLSLNATQTAFISDERKSKLKTLLIKEFRGIESKLER
jgi:adenosine deaminase